MLISNFLKVRKPKKFAYNPMVYDERKEKLDKIKGKYQQGDSEDTGAQSRKFEFNFRNSSRPSAGKHNITSVNRTPLIRLVVILSAVIFLSYIIFGKIDSVVAALLR